VSKETWGNIYWGVWIFGLFLIPELLAFFHVAPWPTLSSTAWVDERTYSILKTVLFGFLMGLAVHIRFQTHLARAEVGGIGIALLVHAMWGLL